MALALVAALSGGIASAAAAHLVLASGQGNERRALLAGLVIALHPALVPYAAAWMTETLSLGLLGAVLLLAVPRQGLSVTVLSLVASGLALGLLVLVRPQMLLLAPVLAAFVYLTASPGKRRLALSGAFALVLSTLIVVAPWTYRNCKQTGVCNVVSANGGWNLLIGTQSENGRFGELRVPEECRTVWNEAAKDQCFGRAAKRAWQLAPSANLKKVPLKWSATFDYFGAGPYYLHASAPKLLTEQGKLVLAAVETATHRLMLMWLLFRLGSKRSRWLAWVALLPTGGGVLGLALVAWQSKATVAGRWLLATLGLTAAVHGVFFGDGRYGLVVLLPLAAVFALSVDRTRG
jgi:hypothetical protein